jgi:hypothetical protein
MAYTTIDDPSVYFQTTLYTGSGSSTQNVVNGGNSDLQPDWVWVKNRTDARWHRLVDSSRGVSKNLYSNEDDAEGTEASVTAFNSDGFSLGTDTGSDGWNEDGDAHVAWQWKANGGTTTSFTESGNNPGGTIQTNTTAGFSIITTTGTGATGTIAHGLGAVPEIIISKQRSNAENWAVYHGSNTSAPETEILTLNTTDATADNANGYNDTAPTSSVFTVHTKNEVNTDARTYVHYVFAPIQGYSKFGVYTGNGNADGPFVYTGFKPAFFIVKRTDASGENFVLRDNAVSPINPVNAYVVANDNRAEANHYAVDLLSNGFKVRTSESGHNHDGGTYIYMAFAESPFVSSEGVPTTAR